MTQPLNDFISSVRMATSIEQERFIIATEQAQIRAHLRKSDPELRPSIVSKMVFLDMIGQNPAWGQMETIALMSDDRFSYKRVGYLGGSIMLDETSEISVLVTQTLLKDLLNPDPNIQNLALAFIANHGSEDVCSAVYSTVQKLMDSKVPGVQKRAGMAILRIVRKHPELSDSFKNSVQSLLNQNTHGVVISGINLVIGMIKAEPKLAKSWAQFVVPFTKILKSLTNYRVNKEYASGAYNDPFMQIKAMQALALLKKRNDELEQILQGIVSSTECKRNTGRAILYQAVETIIAISKKASLRGLAFNATGRLLALNDPNVLYSALSSFARVLYNDKEIISRGSADSMALQRYKSQIIHCLEHKDPSVRKRALDVISALIDEKNCETLVPEILKFSKYGDSEFRNDLVHKIYNAAQRFAPNATWFFDTVYDIIIDNGNYVSADIIASFCELITDTPSIRQCAVSKLSGLVEHLADNSSLMQVSAFVLGEFAMEDNEIINTLSKIMMLPQTTDETRLYIITAISKLIVRVGGDRSKVLQLLNNFTTSATIEVQQRSGEMINMLTKPGVAEELLAPIQLSSEQSEATSTAIMNDYVPSSKQETDLLSMVLNDSSSKAPKKESGGISDLLDMLNADSTTSNQVQSNNLTDLAGSLTPGQSQQNNKNTDFLGLMSNSSGKHGIASNLLETKTPKKDTVDHVQSTASNSTQQFTQPPGSIQLLQTESIEIYGQIKRNQQNPKEIAVNMIFYSVSSRELTNFVCELKVSPGWLIKPGSLSKNVLAPNRSSYITRVVYLKDTNNMPFSLSCEMKFNFGSQPVSEAGIIDNIL